MNVLANLEQELFDKKIYITDLSQIFSLNNKLTALLQLFGNSLTFI